MVQCLSLEFPKRDSASYHLGKPHEEDFMDCQEGPECQDRAQRALVHSLAPEQQQVPGSHPGRELLPFHTPGSMVQHKSRHLLPCARHQPPLWAEIGTCPCLLSPAWCSQNRVCSGYLPNGRLHPLGVSEHTPATCVQCPAHPTQDVGALTRLFPACFDLVPALLQFPLSRCQNHRSEKSSTSYSRAVYCNGRCRERKGNVFLVAIAEM